MLKLLGERFIGRNVNGWWQHLSPLNLNKSGTVILCSLMRCDRKYISLWFIIVEREGEGEREAKLNLIKSGSTAKLMWKHGFGGTC